MSLVIGFVSVALTQTELAVNPLPRIIVKDGLLRNSLTNNRFTPRGFNFVRLNGTNGWHNTFEPGQYDPAAAETMLTNLESAGFNTTRVFVDPTVGPGSVANPADAFLSPAYMTNVHDYLQRSRDHGVYTVFAFSWLVSSDYYNNISNNTPPAFTGTASVEANSLYLNSGTVAAKAQWMADFADSINTFDPNLSSSVLTYQIENEATFKEDFGPFDQSSGTVTGPDNTVYDLSVASDRLALAKAGATYWANTTAQIVKTVDPDALVSTGLFTNRAVGRSGFGQPSSIGDPRFPLNPSTLLDTDLDFLDLHLYPSPSFTLQQDLDSIDWDQVKAKADQLGKPIMMGEYGSFKSQHPTINDAINTIDAHLDAVEAEGFEGSLLWTYDTDEQPSIWNAQESGGAIFDHLASRYSLLPGDIYRDGVLDEFDQFFFYLALDDPNEYRRLTGMNPDIHGDVDGNGVFNNDDLDDFLALFGGVLAASESASVPEPSTIVLLGVAIFGLGLLSRERA